MRLHMNLHTVRRGRRTLHDILCNRLYSHMPCLRRVARMCSSNAICELRTGYEKHGRKNPLPFPFSERSHIGNLRQIRKQGKGRSSKRKENRRLSFLFAHRRGYGVVPAAGRGTFPPSADGESPAEVQRKTPARKGRTRLTAVRAPRLHPVQKRSRPVRANPPAAVHAPRLSGAEKEPPGKGEHACGSSRTPLGRCRKSGKSRKNFPARKGSKNAHSHAEKTSIRTV